MEANVENEKRSLRDRRTLKATDFYKPQLKRGRGTRTFHENTKNIDNSVSKRIKVEATKCSIVVEQNELIVEKKAIDDDVKTKRNVDSGLISLDENYNPVVLLTKCDELTVRIFKEIPEDVKKRAINFPDTEKLASVTVPEVITSSASLVDFYSNLSPSSESPRAFESTPKWRCQPNSSIADDRMFCTPPSSFYRPFPNSHQIYIRNNLCRTTSRFSDEQPKIISVIKRNKYDNYRSSYYSKQTSTPLYFQQTPSSFYQPSSFYSKQTPSLPCYSKQTPSLSYYLKQASSTSCYSNQTPPSSFYPLKPTSSEFVSPIGVCYSGLNQRRNGAGDVRRLFNNCVDADDGDENRRLPPLTCPVCWEIYFEADDFESHYRLMHNCVYLQEFGRIPCLAGPFRPPLKVDADADDSYIPQTDVACKCCFQKNINCSGTYSLFHWWKKIRRPI